MSDTSKKQWVLLIETIDRRGLIYAISKVLADFKINIEQNSEFVDKFNNRFFMRSILEGQSYDGLQEGLKEVLDKGAKIILQPLEKEKIVVFASKEPHAIGDMLIRHRFDTLKADIVAVISNHDVLRSLVQDFGIAFHHISAAQMSRQEHEAKVKEVLSLYNPQYLVLAKYMRILTSDFLQDYKNRIINIHHSFLPAFIGANPYKQAFDRGVKIIGATSHFVNENLDEGPIIYQDVISVDHSHSKEEMARRGSAVETAVLMQALELVFEKRIFVHGNKTVIL